MDESNKLAKGALLVFLAMVFGRFFSYMYVVLVSRLGSAIYGTLSLGFAIFLCIEILSILGLNRGILRYVSYFRGKKDESKIKGVIIDSLKISFCMGFLFFMLLFLFSNKISLIFNNPDLSIVLQIFAFFLPFSIISNILTVSLRAFEKANYEIFIKEFLEKIIKFILTLIFILMGFRLMGAALGYISPVVLSAVLAFIFLQKKVFKLFGGKISKVSLKKELLLYSIPLMVVSLLNKLNSWTDILMIGYFKTSSDVGVYNVASPTAGLLFVAPMALTFLFMPIIGKLYGEGKYEKIKIVHNHSSKWIFMINFWIFLFMAFFSRNIILEFFSENYAGASIPFLILIFGYMFFGLCYIGLEMLSVIKRTKTILFSVAIFFLFNAVLNYVLIPSYGLIGASIATSSSFVIGASLIIICNYKYTKLQPFNLSFIKISACAIASIIAVYFINNYLPQNLLTLFILGIIYALIYLSLLFISKSLDKDDLVILDGLRKKLKSH